MIFIFIRFPCGKALFKELQTNTMGILHLIFRPSLTELQSANPQRGPATSAVWFNQFRQI
jgi:hypothetical protein